MTELRKSHYLSDVACATCASRVRYIRSRNCVACSKRQVKEKRLAAQPIGDNLFGDLEAAHRRMKASHNNDPLADLLGDISEK